MQSFSVLMSVYAKEKPENVITCFESLLAQSVLANEWVLVEDGPLTDDMYQVLDMYQNKYPNLIKRIKLKRNVGLGLALREGIKHCSNELIARMDTDDIARKNRFELQLKEFAKDSKLDICGGQIIEFDRNPSNVIGTRKVPLKDVDIKEYQKKRDALNHMTVMYKKDAVLQAGNYQNILLMEDSLLWANMFMTNSKAVNVPEILVLVRAGNNMLQRRGGLSYFRKYRAGRKAILKTKFISYWDYLVTIVAQLFVTLLPLSLRKWFYIQFLRK